MLHLGDEVAEILFDGGAVRGVEALLFLAVEHFDAVEEGGDVVGVDRPHDAVDLVGLVVAAEVLKEDAGVVGDEADLAADVGAVLRDGVVAPARFREDLAHPLPEFVVLGEDGLVLQGARVADADEAEVVGRDGAAGADEQVGGRHDGDAVHDVGVALQPVLDKGHHAKVGGVLEADAVGRREVRIGLDHLLELADVDGVVVLVQGDQLDGLADARRLKAEMVVEHAVRDEPGTALEVREKLPGAGVGEVAALAARFLPVDDGGEEHDDGDEPAEDVAAPDAELHVRQVGKLLEDVVAVRHDDVPVRDRVARDHGREGAEEDRKDAARMLQLLRPAGDRRVGERGDDDDGERDVEEDEAPVARFVVGARGDGECRQPGDDHEGDGEEPADFGNRLLEEVALVAEHLADDLPVAGVAAEGDVLVREEMVGDDEVEGKSGDGEEDAEEGAVALESLEAVVAQPGAEDDEDEERRKERNWRGLDDRDAKKEREEEEEDERPGAHVEAEKMRQDKEPEEVEDLEVEARGGNPEGHGEGEGGGGEGGAQNRGPGGERGGDLLRVEAGEGKRREEDVHHADAADGQDEAEEIQPQGRAGTAGAHPPDGAHDGAPDGVDRRDYRLDAGVGGHQGGRLAGEDAGGECQQIDDGGEGRDAQSENHVQFSLCRAVGGVNVGAHCKVVG